MRLLFIWMAASVVVVAATAGLLWFSTASSAQFQVEGDRLSVSGQLTLASTERLDRLLEEHEGLTTFVVGDVSPESDATSLMQKGLLLRGAGLETEVAADITLVGDAIYLFLAGVERRLATGAALVATDWQTRVGPASLLPPEHPAHQERLDYVQRMLGSDAFYWYTLEAGEGAIMSDADMMTLGVLKTG